MAKKIKKISIAKLDKIIKDTYEPTSIISWNGVEVIITHTLSLQDMIGFVDSVTKSCFSIKDEKYIPEALEFAIKCEVIEKYSNFRLPVKSEHAYDIIYCTDIFDTIVKHVNQTQLNEIKTSINKKIEYKLCADADKVSRQAEELYDNIRDFEDRLADMFSGVSTDDLNHLVEALTDKKFNEKEVAYNLVEAYSKKLENDKNINTNDEGDE